jgi:hypothetical protein
VTTDVNCFIGPYPFRHVPHPDPDVLVRVLEREQVRDAWVGYLPSAFYRDPRHGNDALYRALEPHAGVLHPVPAIRPDWPEWDDQFTNALERGAPAIRVYPPQWGLSVDDGRMKGLAARCAESGLVLVFTVKFEDLRQRHRMDTAGDLSAAAVRAVARSDAGAEILVTCAGADLIKEIHWGLTPDERSRISYDISWIWGPPEDHLAQLLETIGAQHFVYGSGWPLRLVQTPRANLDLLPDELRGVNLLAANKLSERAKARAST